MTTHPQQKSSVSWLVPFVGIAVAAALCSPESWQLLDFGSFTIRLRHLLAGLVTFGGLSISLVPKILQMIRRTRLTSATADADLNSANNNSATAQINVMLPTSKFEEVVQSLPPSADPSVVDFARTLTSAYGAVVREELSPKLVKLVDKTRVYCYTSILFEETKKITQRAKTLGREIGSEEHPKRYRKKHRGHVESFYLSINDLLEMQWFETAAEQYQETIVKKREILLECSERIGDQLERLEECISRNQSDVDDRDYELILQRISKDLAALATRLDSLNNDCDLHLNDYGAMLAEFQIV